MAWISVKEKEPPTNEPIVYCEPKPHGKGWHVGIAYWTVSETWNPQMESVQNKTGFTHWMPLPGPPDNNSKADIIKKRNKRLFPVDKWN